MSRQKIHNILIVVDGVIVFVMVNVVDFDLEYVQRAEVVASVKFV